MPLWLRRALAHELGVALLEYDGAHLMGDQSEELAEALAAAEDDGDLFEREPASAPASILYIIPHGCPLQASSRVTVYAQVELVGSLFVLHNRVLF